MQINYLAISALWLVPKLLTSETLDILESSQSVGKTKENRPLSRDSKDSRDSRDSSSEKTFSVMILSY